jgi:HAD superfamily hydrolase (TIGR01549 family)
MPRRYDAVFFDVGGTLSWAEPSADVIWARALEEHGHAVSQAEIIRRTGASAPEFNRGDLVRALQAAHEAFRVLPFPRDEAEQEAYLRRLDAAVLECLGIPVEESILDTVARRFREDLVLHVYEDAVPTLQRLREDGRLLGIISNAGHDLLDGLERLGLTPYFDAITYSHEVGYEKPSGHIFHVALKRLDVEAARSVHVGDSYEADVLGSRAVGITPMLIDRDGAQGAADCIVLRSLSEIANFL